MGTLDTMQMISRYRNIKNPTIQVCWHHSKKKPHPTYVGYDGELKKLQSRCRYLERANNYYFERCCTSLPIEENGDLTPDTLMKIAAYNITLDKKSTTNFNLEFRKMCNRQGHPFESSPVASRKDMKEDKEVRKELKYEYEMIKNGNASKEAQELLKINQDFSIDDERYIDQLKNEYH